MAKTSTAETIEMGTVPRGRLANEAYRTREHLTETEVKALLETLKKNRHGQRGQR